MTTDVRPPLSEPPFEQLQPKERRARLLATLVRPFLSGIALVVLYYVMPLDRPLDVATASVFLLGLLAVAVLVAVQVRQIVQSRYPRLRAVGALAVTIPLFLTLFATIYYLLAQQNGSAFNEPLNRTDSLYFTVTVFSTVGFGDIAPRLQVARIVAMVQMIGDLVLIGLIGKVLLGAVTVGLQRSQRPGS